jgi:hypothetical protein
MLEGAALPEESWQVAVHAWVPEPLAAVQVLMRVCCKVSVQFDPVAGVHEEETQLPVPPLQVPQVQLPHE